MTLAAAALELACCLESLQHPRHAARLAPLRAKLQKRLVARFNRQERAFLRNSAPWLRQMASGGITEAERDRAYWQRRVTAKVNGSWDGSTTGADESGFASMITAAAKEAVAQLEIDLAMSLARDQGKRAAAAHLAQRGFRQLASDIDATSRERMANAVADVFTNGGTFDDAVQAIKSTFEDFRQSRAETIARTELADAYNGTILASAREIPSAQKEWAPDGEACAEICTPNVEQGPIPLDEDFDSGDDAPPAHPNCDCSLSIVLPTD